MGKTFCELSEENHKLKLNEKALSEFIEAQKETIEDLEDRTFPQSTRVLARELFRRLSIEPPHEVSLHTCSDHELLVEIQMRLVKDA